MTAAEAQAAARVWQNPALLRLWLSWVITRSLLCLLLAFPLEIGGAGDVRHYRRVIAAVLSEDGSMPVWEYPVGTLLVLLAVKLVAGQSYVAYLMLFILTALAFDFVVTRSLLRCSASGAPNTEGAWLWVVATLMLGPVVLTRLDIFVCAAAAVGLAALAAGRTLAGVSWLWVGAALKIWPGLVVLPLLISSRGRLRLAWPAVLIAACVTAAALASGVGGLLFDFLTYQRNRGLQIESAWAQPLLWARELGATYAVRYEFGSMQIAGAGSTLLVAASTVVFLVTFVASVWFVRTRLRDLPPFEFVSCGGILIISAVLLTNKVLSPQYLLWIIVAVAAAMGHSLLRLRHAAIALIAASATSHLIFPWLWERLIAGSVTATALSTVRVLLLLYVASTVFHQIRRRSGETMSTTHHDEPLRSTA